MAETEQSMQFNSCGECGCKCECNADCNGDPKKCTSTKALEKHCSHCCNCWHLNFAVRYKKWRDAGYPRD